MTIKQLEEMIERLINNYQLAHGTTLAASEILKMLERQKERIHESLDDHYSSFC